MRETDRSLRLYFLLAGVIAVVLSLRDLAEFGTLQGIELPLDWTLAIYVPIISRAALGAAFFVAGLQLRTALPSGAGWIKVMLIAAAAMMLINGALVTAVFGTQVGYGGLIATAIGLAISIYLHRNVTRLAAEAATRAGMPSPPPTARVV